MKKHGHFGKHYYLSEKGDGTLVLMCALSLLMVAFFAVLNSISKKDDRKLRLAIGSFIGSLGVLPGGVQPGQGAKLLLDSAPIVDPKNDLANQGISPKAVNELINYTSREKLNKIITLNKSNEGLTINLSNQAFFTPGSADLKSQNLHLLNQISRLIKESSCNIIIKGHTDNIPIATDTYGSNWELSAARTRSVLWYFLKQDIPFSRLEASGYGEYNAIFPNDTANHRALNRRVEILLVQKGKTPLASKDINIHGFLFKMRKLIKE